MKFSCGGSVKFPINFPLTCNTPVELLKQTNINGSNSTLQVTHLNCIIVMELVNKVEE